MPASLPSSWFRCEVSDYRSVCLVNTFSEMAVSMSESRVVRGVFFALGMLSLALGFIGLFLPLMPTTVFVLLAAFFFARSSERIHGWIVTNRHFGPLVRDYQAGLGIPLYAKVWAVAAIVFSFGVTMSVLVTSLGGRLSMVAVAIPLIWYITSRPTKQPVS